MEKVQFLSFGKNLEASIKENSRGERFSLGYDGETTPEGHLVYNVVKGISREVVFKCRIPELECLSPVIQKSFKNEIIFGSLLGDVYLGGVTEEPLKEIYKPEGLSYSHHLFYLKDKPGVWNDHLRSASTSDSDPILRSKLLTVELNAHHCNLLVDQDLIDLLDCMRQSYFSLNGVRDKYSRNTTWWAKYVEKEFPQLIKKVEKEISRRGLK